MGLIVSSQREDHERAPRLRQIAELIELRADSSANPARARRLAKDARVRATRLELGELAVDEVADMTELIDAMSGSPGRHCR